METFTTGFLNHSGSEIQDFIANHLPEAPAGSNLEPCQYAILDKRSVLDETVVLAHAYSSVHDRDPETMTEAEREQWEEEREECEEDEYDSWREWRVSFKDAERLATIVSFESDFTPKVYTDEFVARYSTVEGVFQLEVAYEAWVGHQER